MRDLAQQGYQMIQATYGAGAWTWLESHPRPSLMLLDLVMTRMDGFALLDRVRNHEDLRDLKVLVVSASYLSACEVAFLLERGGVTPTGPNAREALGCPKATQSLSLAMPLPPNVWPQMATLSFPGVGRGLPSAWDKTSRSR